MLTLVTIKGNTLALSLWFYNVTASKLGNENKCYCRNKLKQMRCEMLRSSFLRKENNNDENNQPSKVSYYLLFIRWIVGSRVGTTTFYVTKVLEKPTG